MISGISQLNLGVGGKEVPGIGSAKLKGEKEQSFGSVLASLAIAENNADWQLNPAEQSAADIFKLLEAKTIDDLTEYLSKNINKPIELPEIQQDQFVFSDKSLSELLLDIMPVMEELEFAEEEAGIMTIGIWELLEQINMQYPNVTLEIENALNEKGNFSKEGAIHLLAIIKMTAIELPKIDLTLKQEQQLEALQTIIQNLNAAFENSMKERPQTRFFSLPFMEVKQPGQAVSQATAQNSHSRDSSNETNAQPGMHFSLISRAEGVHAEMAAQEKSRAEQLFRELQTVFRRANFGQAGGTNRISVKLYPEHLGQLRIELLQTNGVLSARILASSTLGKEMLENHLHQLRNAFLQQNLQVERIEVAQMLQEAPDSERGQAFNEQFKENEKHTKEHAAEEKQDEQKSFEEYMIELEV